MKKPISKIKTVSLLAVGAGAVLVACVVRFPSIPPSSPAPTAPARVPGDVNGDGVVNAADLSVIQANFGKLVPRGTSGDFNGDGRVDAADFSVLLASWPRDLGTPPALPVIKAHHSQLRIGGRPFFPLEVSAKRFISESNPRGWGWPHFTKLADEGWPAVEGIILPAVESGSDPMLWEISGQWPGIGGEMAWVSGKTIADGWTPIMKKTWPAFRAKVEALGGRIALYSGCGGCPNIGSTLNPRTTWTMPTGKDFALGDEKHWVEAMAEIRAELGVETVIWDYFSALAADNPDLACRIMRAIRADPRTSEMTIGTEGWLPGVGSLNSSGAVSALTLAQLQTLVENLVQLEMARKSSGGALDPNMDRVTDPAQRALVSGYRFIVYLHGSEWTDLMRTGVYDRIKSENDKRGGVVGVPCDAVIPAAWR